MRSSTVIAAGLAATANAQSTVTSWVDATVTYCAPSVTNCIASPTISGWGNEWAAATGAAASSGQTWGNAANGDSNSNGQSWGNAANSDSNSNSNGQSWGNAANGDSNSNGQSWGNAANGNGNGQSWGNAVNGEAATWSEVSGNAGQTWAPYEPKPTTWVNVPGNAENTWATYSGEAAQTWKNVPANAESTWKNVPADAESTWKNMPVEATSSGWADAPSPVAGETTWGTYGSASMTAACPSYTATGPPSWFSSLPKDMANSLAAKWTGAPPMDWCYYSYSTTVPATQTETWSAYGTGASSWSAYDTVSSSWSAYGTSAKPAAATSSGAWSNVDSYKGAANANSGSMAMAGLAGLAAIMLA